MQNRQAVQSMRRSKDWTLEDDTVNSMFFCAKLTDSRRNHNLLVYAGAETSDTGAEGVNPDPRYSWDSDSRRVGAVVGDESTESRSIVQPLHIPSVISPERRKYVVVRRTDELFCGGFK